MRICGVGTAEASRRLRPNPPPPSTRPAYRRALGMVYKEPFSGISVVVMKGGMDVILGERAAAPTENRNDVPRCR